MIQSANVDDNNGSFTLFKTGFLPKQRKQNTKTAGMYTNTSATRTVEEKESYSTVQYSTKSGVNDTQCWPL